MDNGEPLDPKLPTTNGRTSFAISTYLGVSRNTSILRNYQEHVLVLYW